MLNDIVLNIPKGTPKDNGCELNSSREFEKELSTWLPPVVNIGLQ